jgi:hypothetical protein
MKKFVKFLSYKQTDDFEAQRQNNFDGVTELDTTPVNFRISIHINHPKYVWGIHTKPRDQSGAIITDPNKYSFAAYPPTFYWGCQNKIGIDNGDRITSATKVLPLEDSKDPDLLDITGNITPALQAKIDAELDALKAATPTYAAPGYNQYTGLPDDKNYEFLHRFVGAGKPRPLLTISFVLTFSNKHHRFLNLKVLFINKSS